MDAHQPHHVDRLRVGRRQRLVGLPGDELRKLRDEVVQRENARLVEAPRLVDELPQVGQFPLAQELGQQHGVVPGPRQRLLEQPGDGHAVLHRPQARPASRRRTRTRWACSAPNSARQFLGQQPCRQTLRMIAPARRASRPTARTAGSASAPDQAHLVVRIGQRPQQVHHVVDFLLGIKGMAADQVIVDSPAPQGLLIVRHVGQGAEQAGRCRRAARRGRPLPARPRRFLPHDFLARVQHGAEPPGDPVGLAPPLPLGRGQFRAPHPRRRRPLPLPARRPRGTRRPAGGRPACGRPAAARTAASSVPPNSSANRALTNSSTAGWLRKFSDSGSRPAAGISWRSCRKTCGSAPRKR